MTSFHDPAKPLARPTQDFSWTEDGMAGSRSARPNPQGEPDPTNQPESRCRPGDIPLPALPVLTIAAARSPAMVRRSPNVSGANG